MSELKPCPFCGAEASYCNGSGRATNLKTFWCNCQNEDCLLFLHPLTVDMWQSRPIEDELRAEIARLQEKLHDEMSQLEIATDLGNKRWLALNDIYENGEKHSANWCKRKAQEGLGIK